MAVNTRLNESFGQEEINPIFIFDFFRAEADRGVG